MLQNEEAFSPDWRSPPGDTILDILDERGMSIEAFSLLIDETPSFSQSLISGKARITARIALKLSEQLGSTKDFWLTREDQFRNERHSVRSIQSLSEWARLLPISDMKKFGWLSPGKKQKSLVEACLNFFDVPSLEAWKETYGDNSMQSAFRKSAIREADDFAVAAWLRQGEILSNRIKINKWDKRKFLSALPELKRLTWYKNPSLFLRKLKEICANCGVYLVVVRAPKGCSINGAARFNKRGSPIIQLSFRYLSDDHFWFTFFHECGHLVLHENKIPFFENDGMSLDQAEEEANLFASNQLISLEFQPKLLNLKPSSKDIMSFAKKAGVSPGIVVGQLQHYHLIGYNQFNHLKRRFQWK
ncbi:ImmA/IrrE family metallo-endopeptidase [Iodidimonas gelatinilytica]|nr:ImmA/IrrE family metallo-endopeptidase [Iodidimonas gelatinilytica]